MTKLELVDAVVQMTRARGPTAKLVEHCLDWYLDHIIDALACGETVQLKGFGRFEVVTAGARKAYDFKNRKTVDLPPRRRVVFTPYARLKNAVERNEDA